MNGHLPADAVLMIRPKHFHFNSGTSLDNKFQHKLIIDGPTLQELVTNEFDNFVEILRRNKVNVIVFTDSDSQDNPDAVFPNNWFSTHSNGSLVIYPIYSETRRKERRTDIVEFLKESYNVKKHLDFSRYEKNGLYLESTGSVVFDHDNKVAYAALSARTSMQLVRKLCRELGYREFCFDTMNTDGFPVYHTNVLMAVGKHYVVCCTDAVQPEAVRLRLKNQVVSSGKDLIEITLEQMNEFAGNILEIRNSSGELLTIISERACVALALDQLERISKYSKIVSVPIPTIEHVGGGGVRCMMAEIFLDKITARN